jgi:hypothetical protein
MNVRHLLAAALGGLLLASCGAARGGPDAAVSVSPSSASPAATPAASGPDIMITDQSSGVAAQTGQRIVVFLNARPGLTDWSDIRSSDVQVVAPAVIDVMVPHGVTAAAFNAVGAGVALIMASAGPLCIAPAPCPLYAALFTVQVTVTVRAP